ncbi:MULTISPECIES: DUF4097 family beta strand repeat-containing protein [unclassified Streptomyces]|uniref:DUF4097 family beta strand repeat-containing protein n=1 Tax=unclassified Streptomyces TaxID=2593676 RepID=UPI0011CE4023|nr:MULTISPECIES: DUF4097 family beta strand repeat-containing protein [unclassified Streptomyces]TXS79779.1 hypothetical protein EAO69_01445 [Streptomyces sp. me109]
MQKFDTPAPVSAVLDIPAGRVRLIAADRADTTVEILPLDASRGRDVKAAERTEVTCSGGVLRIETAATENRILGASGSLDVTVHLPAGSRIEAKAPGADLRGVGRLGDVVFEGGQATVDLDEAGSARLTLLAGDVSVGRLDGAAEITTRQGDIRVAEAVRGAVTLRTEHGGISIGAAHGVSASLDAGTGYGRVHNTLRNTAGAGAGLAVRATTAYGDITAHSL